MNRTLTVLSVGTLAVALAIVIAAAIAVDEVQQWVPRPHLLSTTLVSLRCATPD